uniref:chemotaxis protein CheW n=1 Tax=Candidatus Electronema sp. TaxID=2698783 RepID=UPI0040568766
MAAQQGSSGAETALAALLAEIDQETAGALRREQLADTGAAQAETLTAIGRHLCFLLAGQQLAVPLSLVLEVGELETLRPLPFLPAWAEGVTNIRGEIVSVTNLAVFFSLAGRRKSRTVLILHDGGGRMKTAVTVDKITGTRLLYQRAEQQPADGGSAAVPAEFLSGRALYLAESSEHELDLFDSAKLLAALRLN